MDDLSGDAAESEVDGLPPQLSEIILQNIHDAVYTLDANGRITWVNEVVLEEFDTGYTREDLIGAPVSKVLSSEDISQCIEIITDLLEDGGRDSGHCEVSVQTAYGNEIPCDLHLALLPFDDGEFQGTIGVLRDITDRKRREQGLMVLNRVLRHNLRHQLNLILGHADVLEQGVDDQFAVHVQPIIAAAESLDRLGGKARHVEDTLTADEQSIESIEAVELVEARCDDFDAQFPEADISVETPSSVWVYADHRLTVIVDNLLENAITHSDQDSPVIDVSITTNSKERDWVELRVADNGPNIPPMEVESVLNGEETSLKHGSGLGLWLVKWWADRYGGGIEFNDRSPRGNVVLVRLREVDPPSA